MYVSSGKDFKFQAFELKDKTNHRNFPSYLMIYLNAQMAPPTRNANQDAMMQMLQVMLEDREAERAERQANIAALQ